MGTTVLYVCATGSLNVYLLYIQVPGARPKLSSQRYTFWILGTGMLWMKLMMMMMMVWMKMVTMVMNVCVHVDALFITL